MSGYLPTIRFDTEYEGDEVVIELNALTRNAFIKILPVLAAAKGSESADRSDKMAVYGAACEVLSEHIVAITGLRDKNGNAVTKEAMLGAVYFIDLVIAAFNKLVQESSLGKLKSTDSEAKSPESIEAHTPTTSH